MKDFKKAVLRTGLAIAILGGLAIYAYHGEFKKGKEAEKAREEAKKLFTFDRGAVTAAGITVSGATTSCRKDGGRWTIVSPVAAAADQSAVDGVVSAMEGLRVDRVIDDRPASLAAYGLEKPEIRVALGGPSPAPAVSVGVQNSFDNTFYVMRDGDPKVYQASSSIKWQLAKDLFALRDKRLFVFEKNDDIQGVQWKAGGLLFTARREGGGWGVTAGDGKKTVYSGRADDDVINGVISALRSARASSVVSESGEGAGFGLDGAEGMVRLDRAGGITEELIFARRQGGAAKVYARLTGSPVVWEISEQIVKDLEKKPFDVRFRKAVDFRPEDASRIIMRDGDDSWEVVKSRPDAGESGDFGPMLHSLLGMKASGFKPVTKAAAKETSLESPSRSISVLDAGGKEIGRVELGAAAPGGVWAKSGLHPDYMLLSGDKVDGMPWKKDGLKDGPGAPRP
ncbi:MAG: DUF4340 domain-containing protein [Myxococcota bacterium]|jgi:hypothetical protein